MSAFGPSPTSRDVRDLVVIKGKADLTRTSNFRQILAQRRCEATRGLAMFIRLRYCGKPSTA
jgi:hypothetical protein